MTPVENERIERQPIERYTLHERVSHWFASITYVYLLLTGLALFSPHLYWIAAVLGGGPTIRFWHPWVGLLFVVAIIWMHRLWRADLRFTDTDRVWNHEVKKYIENHDEEMPPSGRFNAGQKEFYWVMLFGTALLLISGLVMWFPEYVPFKIHGLRAMAVVLHEIAALITIGAFIIHIYMSILLVPGSVHAMVHGYVSRGWARAHHRLWFESVSHRPVTGK